MGNGSGRSAALTLSLALGGAGAIGCNGPGASAADAGSVPDLTTSAPLDLASAPDLASGRRTIQGTTTIALDFSALNMMGLMNCTLTRTTMNGVEDRSAPWICPMCDTVFHADIAYGPNDMMCWSQVPNGEPLTTVEWLGFANWMLYTAGANEIGSGRQDTRSGNQVSGTSSHSVMGVTVTYNDAFTLGGDNGDPLNGMVPPASYKCGWPRANPAPYTGSYNNFAVGSPLPDGVFRDSCGDPVRLWDFQGTYLIVDIAAIDCIACVDIAGSEKPLLTRLGSAGIPTRIITLLSPSLEAPATEVTDPTLLTNWGTQNGAPTEPVLADRGYGISMFRRYEGATVNWPSYLVVGKDLTILAIVATNDGYTGAETAIHMNAGK